MLNAFVFIAWLVAGVLNICCENIPKASFVCCWLTLMLTLLCNMIA